MQSSAILKYIKHLLKRKSKPSKLTYTQLIDVQTGAANDCAESQFLLGQYYYHEQREIDLALYWYDKAAIQDHSYAAIMAFSIDPNDSRREVASSLMLTDCVFWPTPIIDSGFIRSLILELSDH